MQSVDVQRERPPVPLSRASALQALREARRLRNWQRESLSMRPDAAQDPRCECARVDCRVRLPPDIERHRRRSWQFIVAPPHTGADTIIGAADHFFVVEPEGGCDFQEPPRPPLGRLDVARLVSPAPS
jgi:hypothetical protein